MKAKLHEVVELCDAAAERVKARYGRIVQVDDDSVFIRVRPGEAEWFVHDREIKSAYVAR
jgi:Tfp pilus assembly protein PilP